MPRPAITIEVLPAGYGDCLLVTCPVGRRTWRMLVDTGPDECFPTLQARLAKLPADSNGQRQIDLFVVTHIDHDHIGGVAQLLNDRSIGLSFGNIWFNAAPQPPARGVAEGQPLAQLLGAQDMALPWDRAFGGKAMATDGTSGLAEVPGSPMCDDTLTHTGRNPSTQPVTDTCPPDPGASRRPADNRAVRATHSARWENSSWTGR